MPSTTDTRISPSKLFGKESGEGKLARIVRSNKKGIAINARKITILKNIEKAKKDPIGDKLPGGGGSLKSILGDVAASMDGIRDTLIAQNQVDANAAEDERKAAEQASRGKQEKDLEGKFQGLKQVANKVLAPIKGIWEQLINFVTTIFLGKIAMKLFAWFSNPDNTKKVEAIGRFLKDFWPALLAGYLLFGNALGGFIVGLGAKLIGWAATMLKTVIPALAKAMARMGGGGVGGFVKSAAVGGIVVGGAMLMDRMTDDEDLGPDDVGNRPVDKKNKGGSVSGSGNTDTVPAMLTPGEFVMSAPAVQKWGVDTLEGMNAAGGGTNKPQKDNGGVTHAAGGGLISGVKDMVGGMMGGDNFAKDMVKEHEGLRTDVYKDSKGLPTVGYGHLVDGGSPEDIRDLEIGDTITEKRANQLFEMDFKHHKKAAQQIPGWSKGNKEQKAALIDLTFNMGPAWYKGFPKFSAALEAGNFEEAGKQLVDSDWYGQVGRRSPTIVDLIRGKGVSKGSYLKGGSGSKVGSGNNVSASESGGVSPANISAPPGAPPPLPPIKPSSTAAYTEQLSQQGGGKPDALSASAVLPDFDAGAMASSAKIRVLGISV